MKRLFTALTGAVLMTAFLGAVSAQTSDKVVTTAGTVSAISENSITIKSKNGESTLTIDSKTQFIGKGLGTKNAKLKEENKPTLATDFINVGDEVSASYHEESKLATRVRVINAAPAK
jgi:hypothetical protein